MHAAPRGTLVRLCVTAARLIIARPAGCSSSTRQQTLCSMSSKAGTQYDQGWLDDWRSGVDPGTLWDAGGSSSQLLQLLSSGQLPVQGKRTLVPGCGYVCWAGAGACG
jgi:hypothetical protein